MKETRPVTRLAAIYARVSTDRQREEGTVQSQIAELRELARERDLLVAEELVFSDEGFSGATLARPALERLRDRAADGAFEILLGANRGAEGLSAVRFAETEAVRRPLSASRPERARESSSRVAASATAGVSDLRGKGLVFPSLKIISLSDDPKPLGAYGTGGGSVRARETGIRLSMGDRGSALDNAVCESFFASMEKELTAHERYRTREEARGSIFAWVEGEYNRARLHSALGYRPPLEFEELAA